MSLSIHFERAHVWVMQDFGGRSAQYGVHWKNCLFESVIQKREKDNDGRTG